MVDLEAHHISVGVEIDIEPALIRKHLVYNAIVTNAHSAKAAVLSF